MLMLFAISVQFNFLLWLLFNFLLIKFIAFHQILDLRNFV